MTERTSNLIAGLSGILAIVGAEIAFFAIVGATPEMGASADTINDFGPRVTDRGCQHSAEAIEIALTV